MSNTQKITDELLAEAATQDYDLALWEMLHEANTLAHERELIMSMLAKTGNEAGHMPPIAIISKPL